MCFFRKKDKRKVIPTFGSVEDFHKLYKQGQENLIIGKFNDSDVALFLNENNCNNLIVINDDERSVLDQLISPIVLQSKLSYCVYDEDGKYYESLSKPLLDAGYDVQMIDLESENCRIDPFEIVNITKNSYWTTILLLSAMKAKDKEATIAYNMLMGMMQYLLAIDGNVTAAEMRDLFNKMFNNDVKTLEDMLKYETSAQYIKELPVSDESCKAVYKRVYKYFIKPAFEKAKNPNVFTVTAHKKNMAFFIKEPPAHYKFLVSMLIFNLHTANALFGNNDITTLIIDTEDDAWYHRHAVRKALSDGGAMQKGTAELYIREKLSECDYPMSKNHLLIYMHSDDDDTLDAVRDHTTINRQLSDDEKAQLSKEKFRKKPIPEATLQDAPITINELKNYEKMLIIDSTHAAKPIQCERLRNK